MLFIRLGSSYDNSVRKYIKNSISKGRIVTKFDLNQKVFALMVIGSLWVQDIQKQKSPKEPMGNPIYLHPYSTPLPRKFKMIISWLLNEKQLSAST